MNFDYLEITKRLDKDKNFCLDYLEEEAVYSSGWEYFKHEGYRDLSFRYHSESNIMVVKGSLSYFMSGQNFKTDSKDLEKGMEYLSDILGAEMFESEVKAFEFGTTLQIPYSPKEVFNTHVKVKGMKTIPFDYGRYFDDRVLRIKLYDAGRNIKLKLDRSEREGLSLHYGYDPTLNYLKIENHYKKPEVALKQRDIKVRNLFDNSFRLQCKNDLIDKYRSIMKARSIQVLNKKQFSSSAIPLILLKEYEEFLPCKVEDLIQRKIKEMPESILSKEDKKKRSRQLRQNLRRLQSIDSCGYDLSEMLINKALNES